MKAKRIRFKRTVALALCMMMLASNLLVTNAATNVCYHTDYRVTKSSCTGGTSIDEGYHDANYSEKRLCLNCGIEFDVTRIVREVHSMNRYTDEGHFGVDSHTYRAHCTKCGFSQLIVIYCPGGSSHAKP